MKFNRSNSDVQTRTRFCCGITLIECLVYISLLFVILGVAHSVMDRFQDGSRLLTRVPRIS